MENPYTEQVVGDALELKEKGNTSIKEGNFKEAALLYTQAIKIDPTNASIYSNRSLAYLRLKHYSLSFQDALEAVRLNPQWAKGYFRKAEVEAAVGLTEEAALSYTQTLQLQPQDVGSVLASIKKVTDEQKRKKEVKDKLPWVCCCVGVIVGVVLVLLDHIIVEHESPRNPLIQVGTMLTIACASYGVGRYYVTVEESEGRKQLHPPGFQDPDAGKQPWVIGSICGLSIIFLDITFIEIVGIRENPMKILTLAASIVGAGIGISYVIYLTRHLVKSPHYFETTPVDCKLPFSVGFIGASISVVGFVIDYIINEEPFPMGPLKKASVVFAIGCLLWCLGKSYNMFQMSYNKKLEQNSEDIGGLGDTLWCVGLIVGTCFIIIDCTVADVIGLRENPMKSLGFALSIAGGGFGLGSLLAYMKSFEQESPEELINKDFQPVSEETQVPEKTSNKYTKAQARYRYKKGKM